MIRTSTDHPQFGEKCIDEPSTTRSIESFARLEAHVSQRSDLPSLLAMSPNFVDTCTKRCCDEAQPPNERAGRLNGAVE
ncbi:hypothetical protein TruAng_001434 [Truncatella angustata]|nr:hypothetical protein TruAng_001434 [Truncatella angustata]